MLTCEDLSIAFVAEIQLSVETCDLNGLERYSLNYRSSLTLGLEIQVRRATKTAAPSNAAGPSRHVFCRLRRWPSLRLRSLCSFGASHPG